MKKYCDEIREQLGMENFFQTFPFKNYAPSLQKKLREEELIRKVLELSSPKLIIEVGSWKGDSASVMARFFKDNCIDGAIICVDTWLGGVEHINNDHTSWGIMNYLKFGYSTLYFHFLANMMHAGIHQYIIPFPNTSLNSSRYMVKKSILADMVYVDASHEEDDVYADLNSYWDLLKPGGLMLGDDWHVDWYGVICAVNRFSKEKCLVIQSCGEKWFLQKPL
ncbi:class I SAM-dependent methyltransferase [Desulfonatronum parangueonense]